MRSRDPNVLFSRRSPRWRGFDYASSEIYFVTIVTDGRRCVFGDVEGDRVRLADLGRLVERCLRAIPLHHPGIFLHEHVVMPNHVHALLELGAEAERRGTSLVTVVSGFKASVTRAAKLERSPWQRSFHDRVIRDEKELVRAQQYILENPKRWAEDRENPDRWM